MKYYNCPNYSLSTPICMVCIQRFIINDFIMLVKENNCVRNAAERKQCACNIGRGLRKKNKESAYATSHWTIFQLIFVKCTRRSVAKAV